MNNSLDMDHLFVLNTRASDFVHFSLCSENETVEQGQKQFGCFSWSKSRAATNAN